jgi:hypothetical protein
MVQSAQDRRGDQLGRPDDRSISLRLRNLSVPDASHRVPEVLQEVDDGIHENLIAEEASDGNLS